MSILDDVLTKMTTPGGDQPAAAQPAAQAQPAAEQPVQKKKLFGYGKDWQEEYPAKS